MKTKKTLKIAGVIIAILLLSVFVIAAKTEKGDEKGYGKKERISKSDDNREWSQKCCGGMEECGLSPFFRFDKMKDLSDEQKTKIDEIADSYKKERDELIESMKTKGKELRELIKSDPETPDAIKSKINEIGALRLQLMEKRIDSIFKIKGILTKEQWEKAKSFAEGWRMHSQASKNFRHKMMKNGFEQQKGENCPMKDKNLKQDTKK